MKWLKKDVAPSAVKELAGRYDIDLLTASVFARRGITAADELRYFLEDDPRWLHNPFMFGAMEDAVDRVMLARDEKEKVLIFGDRDADGVTSTVLLYEALKAFGLDVRYQLPFEDERYGLSLKAVGDFAAGSGTLIVTVDCGISNAAEIKRARELGVDVIVLDHHLAREDALPDALAVVDPKVEGSGYPFRDLAGCGVAYKFVRALAFAETEFYKQELALLNVRPVNDAYLVEAVRLSNLVESGRMSETIVPGMLELDKTRLVPFLSGRQILVWDGELQKKLLEKALGRGAEVQFHDISKEIGEALPPTRGQSLLRLREQSRSARYSDAPVGELDVFASVFVSFAYKRMRYFGDRDLDALQLVAIGTVADQMPLRNENRILVRKGLEAMNRKPRAGVAELLARSHLVGKRIGAHEIAFQVAPVINAAGRMGKPGTAAELFLSESPQRRLELAEELDGMNLERRKLGATGWDSVLPEARDSLKAHDGKLVLVGSDKLNRGITGTLAARLVNLFNVPAIVAAFLPDGKAVGSIRSTRGFAVTGLLESCSELFIDYGGHDSAAGFSLEQGKWTEFQSRVAGFCAAVTLDDESDCIDVDAELPHSFMKPEIMELADRFEPFGEANEKLVFMALDVPISGVDIVGKSDPAHLKLTLDFGTHKWPALYWEAADKLEREFSRNDRIDLVFNLSRNWWNGMEQSQLIVLDVRKSIKPS
ncbi:MAG: single-stranded-DNA-specific exonuclease RecJ [Spirochaetes bacterium]|nr:single-stranded-DNA-specific exonuclease RecJ [Spirochaetota bacterium]